MSVLSVRIPKDLEEKVPKRERSMWVIEAIRQRLRRERIGAIARSAGENAKEELEALAEWEGATAPLPERRR